MKFPLYNECPNCGHPMGEHDQWGTCSAAVAPNRETWNKYYTLKEEYDSACDHDKERIAAEIQDAANQIIPDCTCSLKPEDIRYAISIQAAIEVALQRAGVGDFRGPEGDFNIPGSVKRDAL